MEQKKQNQTGKQHRPPQLGEKPKPGQQQHGEGGDPRTLPGSKDLGDQSEPQDQGGMTKGT